ncbi:hypothetical protein JRQ81_001978 [Phrynocephalus forsythii]|uniref:Serine/threonine-protein kinase 11-interacting protein n=1 Tax=Phrynocephalus forsythii TaxID=171643 RepID=A0A9Q0Y9I1_9SAUR|nr:hypothetical protein JRQ81_001978 [Phrynocephalus forsythii]
MAPTTVPKAIMLQSLAKLLQDSGDLILDGTSTLTLFTSTLQILTQIFEQHLLPRKQNHGFIALSSHPTETSSILQAQFLFDVLQKTLSLKLIHVPDSALPAEVKISPFKSLRRLELKCVPLHCLRGLRFIYSQLEALTCSKCVKSLKEIFSACGGDLSTALPWLELQTVNFSYNFIASLDESLQLLNALRALDLSHNLIQDCERYLTVLTELEYLNVGYNFLSKMPNLGLHSRAKLVTLILRYNQLDNINGIEQLPSLQHLDVAYNLLLDHALLAPLSLLHNLRRLDLKGNPLWFQENHRQATIMHLSSRAISCNKFLLDEESVSASDLQLSSRLDHTFAPPLYMATLEGPVPDISALENSCAADQSESQSAGESKSARLLPRKRPKVRRAGISEPTDTEHENRTLPLSAGIVRRHQAEMEQMDSFRDRFGAHWLRYSRRLKTDGQARLTTTSSSPTVGSLGSSGGSPDHSKNVVPEQKISDVAETKDLELPHTLAVVEGHKAKVGAEGLATKEDKEQEEKKHEADLCQPVLVSQIEGDGDPEPDWIFLRVTTQHVLEVELTAARILHKLELQNLQKIETSEMPWKRKDPDLEYVFPVLTLHFSYICKERQRRRYVVLDDHPEICLNEVIRVLKPILEKNKDRSRREGGPRFQCLKCKREFPGCTTVDWQHPDASKEMTAFSEEDKSTSREPILCPSCSSDHVVILPCERRSSTPQEGPGESQQDAASGKFYIGEDDISETGTSSSMQLPELSGTQSSATHSSSRISEGGEANRKGLGSKSLSSSLSRTDTNGGGLLGSYNYSTTQGQTPSDLSLSADYEEYRNVSPITDITLIFRDFTSVDHRLKLYLDMEVFEEAEEFRCYLKMGIVKDGQPGEFPALLVISDIKIYVLEVTGEMRGLPPSHWLKKVDSHSLSDLSGLEAGLCHQSLHMEFANSSASYTLLLRNQNRCRRFIQCLTILLQELPAKSREKIPDVTVVEMSPQHPLWPLIEEDLAKEAVGGSARPFFYLLAYLIQGDSAFPVTVLSTRSRISLVEEDHQWHKALPSSALEGGAESEPKSSCHVKASEAISTISGVLLYRFCPFDVKLQLYDEVLRVESTWHLRTECHELLAELVEWLRVPWEEMFLIPLRKTVLPMLE